MSNMNSTMTMTNKMVPQIDVLFNMIKEQQYQMNLMKNQLQSQSELISSLQKQVEFITPKGRPQVDIQAEVDMLLSDEYLSDSKTSNGISTESIDDPFISSITCNESKKEERKSSFRTSSPHPILNKGPVRILKYSEKAFVVIGDTKKHSTTLNKMGGKWNISLTYKETGEKFMGWIFSNRQLDKVSMWIDLGCL